MNETPRYETPSNQVINPLQFTQFNITNIHNLIITGPQQIICTTPAITYGIRPDAVALGNERQVQKNRHATMTTGTYKIRRRIQVTPAHIVKGNRRQSNIESKVSIITENEEVLPDLMQ